ncbi:Similar to ZNF862: Zinc finger protein 862 (Homo sapiens) [Cotesia congregata]|uniref:Similar to ZNF862: Zinc finger protein 862 (Homo sapiens) n=1 Tax=Cotesia congregata TaxID=51543 RepID=A0A8J2HHW3_COTCN|nr:Similar to ZNF862: Zinc finger protein 862 (Homo sapiens) [Cotesia congregata]
MLILQSDNHCGVDNKASSKSRNKSLDTKTSRAEIQFCSFLAEHNLSFKVMDHLTPLLQECFPDSEIVKQMRLKSSKSVCVIKNVIGYAEKEELAGKLQKTFFSVLIDVSTDISMTQTLCIIVRYYDEDLGRIVSHFWELCKIFNDDSKEVSTTAQHLFNCVRESFQRFSVSFDKIIGFGSDGCNAIMGKNNSVRTRFGKCCPNIYIMTCICHSLHLCASEACDSIPSDCEKLFHSIYNHFSSSCKRQHEFKQYQQFLELKNHKILRPVEIRWLSVTAVVTRLLETKTTSTTINFETEELILQQLNDPIIKLYYHFLEWILPKFSSLNKLFQSEKPLITVVHKTMSSTYVELLKNFMVANYVNKTPLSEINPADESKYVNILNVYTGVNSIDFFNKPEYSKSLLKEVKIEFLTNCRSFLVKGCLAIQKRYDFDNILLKNLFIINPAEAMAQSTRNKIPSLLPLMKQLPRLVTKECYQSIDNEWRQLPSFTLPEDIKVTDPVDSFWHKLKKFEDKDGIWSFEN